MRRSKIKRIFIYSIQSSGASLFTFFLSQMPDSIGIIDLDNSQIAPQIYNKFTVILKATINTSIDLRKNLDNFKPNFKIFFLRNPGDVYLSLYNKWYRNYGGSAEEKLKIMEKLYSHKDSLFDMTLYYEDFVKYPHKIIKKLNNAGIILPKNSFCFPRSLDEVLKFNMKHCPWCKENYDENWDFGNIHRNKLKQIKSISYDNEDKSILKKVKKICPVIFDYYQKK